MIKNKITVASPSVLYARGTGGEKGNKIFLSLSLSIKPLSLFAFFLEVFKILEKKRKRESLTKSVFFIHHANRVIKTV